MPVITEKEAFKGIRKFKYMCLNNGTGKGFEAGRLTLEALRNYAAANGEPAVISGKLEYLESLINRFI